jgi:hypothetical protein
MLGRTARVARTPRAAVRRPRSSPFGTPRAPARRSRARRERHERIRRPSQRRRNRPCTLPRSRCTDSSNRKVGPTTSKSTRLPFPRDPDNRFSRERHWRRRPPFRSSTSPRHRGRTRRHRSRRCKPASWRCPRPGTPHSAATRCSRNRFPRRVRRRTNAAPSQCIHPANMRGRHHPRRTPPRRQPPRMSVPTGRNSPRWTARTRRLVRRQCAPRNCSSYGLRQYRTRSNLRCRPCSSAVPWEIRIYPRRRTFSFAKGSPTSGARFLSSGDRD